MTARVLSLPEPGFFKMRLVKDGVYVPALIYRPCPAMPTDWEYDPGEWFMPLDRYSPLQALINGREADPMRVWEGGRPITQEEYEFMLADSQWCEIYAPQDPKANPFKAADFGGIPELF